MAEGKTKLPNLKICIDNTDQISDSEEAGQITSDKDDASSPRSSSDDSSEESDEVEVNVNIFSGQEEALSDSKSRQTFPRREPKKYGNKEGSFVTGFDISSKEVQEKREKRAKRFGIKVPDILDVVDINALYESLGVKENKYDEREVRLNAIHLRGVNEMSTRDVFDYFQEFSAGEVEWIDDMSCNVLWMDRMSAARALLSLSWSQTEMKELLLQEKERKAKEREREKEREKQRQKEMEKEERKKKKKTETEKSEKMDEDEADDYLNLMSEDETDENSKETKSTEKKSTNEQASGDTDQEMKEETKEEEAGEITDKSDDEKSSTRSRFSRHRSRLPRSLEKMLDSMPPGVWRFGVRHPKAQHLFVRFATKADHKQRGAERHSKYYVKHGNPNYGGMKGLISSSRKRKLREGEWDIALKEAKEAILRQKALREKMERADKSSNEEEGEEEVEEENIPQPVHRRYSSGEEEMEKELEVLLADSVPKRSMRMYADDVEEENYGKRVKTIGSNDARAKIERRRKQATKESKSKVRTKDLRSSILNRGEENSDEEEELFDFSAKRSSNIHRRLGKRHSHRDLEKLPSLTIEVSDTWS